MFAKNNLARLKRENPGTPMKDVMALVGKRWKVYKEGQGLGRDDRDESPTAQGGRGNAVVVISDSEGDSPAVDGVGVLMNDLKVNSAPSVLGGHGLTGTVVSWFLDCFFGLC